MARRRWAWALGTALLLPLLALLALWAAWRSDAGLDWALRQVPGLEVQGRQGRPDGGAFGATRLAWRGGGLQLVVEDLAWQGLQWRWRPHAGAWLRLQIDRPTARRVEVRRTPAPPSPRSTTPPDLWLPLELVVEGLAIGTLQVDDAPPVSAIEGDLHLGDELGAAHRIERLAAQVTGLRLAAAGRIATTGDQALRATLEAAPLQGAALPWTARAQANGRLAEFRLDATLAAADAQARVQATLRPLATWPLGALSATTQGLDLAALSPALPHTQLDVRVVVDAPGADQPLQADLTLDNAAPGRWSDGRLPLQSLQARVTGRLDDRRRVDLPQFDARLSGGRVQGQGRWEGDALALQLTLEGLRPARLDARAPALRLSGPVTLALRGLPAPDGSPAPGPLAGEVTARLDGLVEALRRAVQLQAEARFEAPAGGRLQAEVQRLQLASGAARATLQGRAERDGASTWRVQGRAELQRFDPALWWPGREGAWRRGPHRLDGRLEADATLAPGVPPRGRAQLQLAPSVLAGVPLSGRVDWQGDAATTLGVDLVAAQNRLQADLRWRDPVLERGRLVLDAPALAALSRWADLLPPSAAAWWPTAGRVQVRAQAQGRWPDLQTEATVVAESLARGEQRLDRLDARLEGRLASHRFSLSAATPLRPPAWVEAQPGGTRALLQGSGAWQGRAWQGRIGTLQVAPRREGATPWVAAQALQARVEQAAGGGLATATLAPGRVELLGATLAWTQARWQAAGGSALDALLEPLPVAPWLARFMPEAGWAGDLRVGARARVRQAPALEADVVVERRDGDLSLVQGGRRQALGLTALRLALQVQGGRWLATQALSGSQIGVLAGSQTVRAGPGDLLPPPASPLEGVLTLQSPDLDVWSAWLPAGWHLGGDLRATALLSGTAGAPRYQGRVEGERLAVGNLLEGVDLSQGSLLVTLQGDDARIERLRLQGGEGTLAVQGGASFGAAPQARLRVVAERLQVLGRVDRRVVASGSADVVTTGSGVAVDGRFRVDEGLVDITRSEAASLDADVVVVNRPGAPPAPPKPARPIAAQLALVIDLGEQLRLRGRGLDTRLAGLLRVSTPEGRLALDGTVRTLGGTYQAYGQNLQIERGLIRFEGELAAPTLDILAVRPDIDQRVGVAIFGTALNPRVRLFSEPELSELDKISWLVLGRASAGLGSADTALLQRAALALLTGDKGGGGGFVQRLGLDELSVGQSGAGDTRETVVTLGKQINRRLFIGYERGLNAAAGSWQLIYRIARRFTLRASSGEESALDFIWQWRWR